MLSRLYLPTLFVAAAAFLATLTPPSPTLRAADESSRKDREKDSEKKGENKASETAPTVRPMQPPTPPNPDELKLRPNKEGRIRFNFVGQPWPAVLEWLGQVSNMSLDWQELPGDYLNLTTQRDYSVEEARDLINRHLLARGYTLIVNGELLAVADIKKLDSGLVPRVAAEDLAARFPHDYVRVSFPLDSLVAEAAVEELKPLLSPNGRLTAMKSTNRVEAMDAVTNLREIHKILSQEQSSDGKDRLVREFELQYTRAFDVYVQLMKLMGMEERQTFSVRPQSNQESQGLVGIQQQMAQMQEQLRQSGRTSSTSKSPERNDVSLVVNPRRNTLLAMAPPDKMALITQAVKAIDVPLDRDQSLIGNLGRMQVYRLANIEPISLVQALEQSGDLDPMTRLQADEKSRAIVVVGSLADHMIVRTVIEKLDGTGRRFEVIPLRRLAADQLAGTVDFMINGAEDKQNQRRYDGYDSYSRSREKPNESKDKFRVDADVENNRLLLWANDLELGEVRNLLTKLGEITDRRERQGGIRILEAPAGEDAEQLLERLRKVWPTVAPNPLVLPAEKPAAQKIPATSKPDAETPAASPTSPATPAVPNLPATRTSQLRVSPRDLALHSRDALAQVETPRLPPRGANGDAANPAAEAARDTADPVRLTVDENGRLILSSRDAAALDLLEDTIRQVSSPKKDFHIFYLKHAPSYWVRLNLVEFFKDDSKDQKNQNTRYYYYYEPPPTNDTKSSLRLSKRQSLKFIADTDSNTIVVQGAEPAQLKVIGELIELYDKPEPTDAKSARMTSVVPIRWGNANTIADAVKDVYRDLLSSNDKALSQTPDQKSRPQSQNTYIYGDSGEDKEKRVPITFKGKLSIGIDEVSNTLLVSTEGEFLLQNVTKMIQSLDEAARPAQSVQVLKLGGGINTDEVKKAVLGILTEQAAANGNGGQRPRAATPQPKPNPQGQPGN